MTNSRASRDRAEQCMHLGVKRSADVMTWGDIASTVSTTEAYSTGPAMGIEPCVHRANRKVPPTEASADETPISKQRSVTREETTDVLPEVVFDASRSEVSASSR